MCLNNDTAYMHPFEPNAHFEVFKQFYSSLAYACMLVVHVLFRKKELNNQRQTLYLHVLCKKNSICQLKRIAYCMYRTSITQTRKNILFYASKRYIRLSMYVLNITHKILFKKNNIFA